ncbi:tRNA1(Val) (adenine(37)-N6)-methyltransferase [Vibrio sp. 10N.261.51.F12]|uniref:tRNA1(Val) (adenine(37)-N6)-methyltransferase n=1 Tax=Vibrio sp. 10N.261.51.F12 TaxID=3229679 RepID=UPI00354B2554
MTYSSQKTKSFAFKQFKIHSGNAGMPVSTDGVLLGAWAEFNDSSQLLDIGVGTGLLSLMLAQRYTTASIHGIDIEISAIIDARHNIAQSPWHDRIQVTHGDIVRLPLEHRYSGIICNPPYFNSGEHALNQQRATARHTASLAHSELLLRCDQLLDDNRHASFVLPLIEGEQFIDMACKQGWNLARCCLVRATEKKAVNRVLFTICKQQTVLKQETLVIHSANGGYSEAFIHLTRDFYLKM